MKINNRKAFTLIEVVLTVAILSMVLLIVFSIFDMSFKPHAIVNHEFVLQSNVRLASQKIASLIRKSSALFVYKSIDPVLTSDVFPESNSSSNIIVIDDAFINNSPKRTELEKAIEKYRGWSFITLSSDGKELREFIFHKDPSTGKGYYTLQRILEKQSLGNSDMVYEIEFKKNKPFSEDNLLEYSITGKLLDDANKSSSVKPINIKSEVEALSSLQVVDKGDYKTRAKVMFYRTEERPMGVDAEAAVTMVLDISGSMGEGMDGEASSTSNPSRISIMRDKAKDLVNKMASLENININLIPFSNSSNLPNAWENYKYEGRTKDPKAWKNAKNDNGELNDLIGKLVATNGTNVGDGIRRAYYRLKEYPNKEANKYLILLMDGVPTFASVHSAGHRQKSYSSHKGDRFIENGIEYVYSHRTGFLFWYTYYYNSKDPIIEFVTNDIDIKESKHPYNGERYSDGRYAGPGNASDDEYSKPYITEMAKELSKIKNSKGEKNLKVYVIGFSDVPEERAELNFIKGELAKYANEVTSYEVTNAEGLQIVFNDINQIILDDLWHITGPRE